MAWLDNGMSMGSAAAFMITGPATKLTNLGAVKMVMGINTSLYTWCCHIVCLIKRLIINSIWN